MCRAPKWDDDYVPDRGKVLSAAELERIEEFRRYADVDGDGIPWRSLPGVHPKGAYFTRGSGHNESAGYTEDAAVYERLMQRLMRKWHTAAALVPEPVVQCAEGPADLGLISVGSCDDAVTEARDRLHALSAGAGHRHLSGGRSRQGFAWVDEAH